MSQLEKLQSRLDAADKKRALIKEQMKAVKARNSTKRRKEETRMKIIFGAWAMKQPNAFDRFMQFEVNSLKESDQELFFRAQAERNEAEKLALRADQPRDNEE